LEKRIKSGNLTKANINNRGHNKYLKLEGELKVTLDYSAFLADGKWDGWRGYTTNTSLSKDQVKRKL